MKRLTKLACFVVIAALALSASAQTFEAQTIATNVVPLAGSTYSNLNLVIDCRKQDTVALQVVHKSDAASTANFQLGYARSVDGIKYAPSESLLSVQNGTTEVVTITNIPTWGAGFIKLTWASNAHATVNITNLAFKYAIKIQAP